MAMDSMPHALLLLCQIFCYPSSDGFSIPHLHCAKSTVTLDIFHPEWQFICLHLSRSQKLCGFALVPKTPHTCWNLTYLATKSMRDTASALEVPKMEMQAGRTLETMAFNGQILL